MCFLYFLDLNLSVERLEGFLLRHHILRCIFSFLINSDGDMPQSFLNDVAKQEGDSIPILHMTWVAFKSLNHSHNLMLIFCQPIVPFWIILYVKMLVSTISFWRNFQIIYFNSFAFSRRSLNAFVI